MTNNESNVVHKGLKLTGVVKTVGMTKTVIVAVSQQYKHPLYKKAVRRTRRFAAHNEGLELAVGDRVNIAETKPMSRTKHFYRYRKNYEITMVQRKTKLVVADNSGAQEMTIIHIYGASKRKFASLGDVVQCVVRKANPTGIVKNDELVKAVIVRVHKEYRRTDGSYIRFDENAGVVIDNADDKNPRGTRVFGPIARELKEKGFDKIVSMAPEVY